MPSHVQTVRLALRARLATMTGGPYTVLFENFDATPPAPTPTGVWLRERVRTSDSRVVAIGSAMRVRHTGLWLLDIHASANTGGAVADVVVERVVNHFPVWLRLGTGNVVRLTRVFVGNSRISAQWYQVPITIDWQMDTLVTPQ